MTLTELIKSLIDSSKERIKNPIAGAYLLAFLFYNWQPFSILFLSSQSIEKRIENIDEDYHNIWTFLAPMAFALIYSIILPYLMLFIEWLTQKGKENRLKKLNLDKHLDIDLQLQLVDKQNKLRDAQSREITMGNLANRNSLLEDEKKSLQLQLDGEIIKLAELTKSYNILQLKNHELEKRMLSFKNDSLTDIENDFMNNIDQLDIAYKFALNSQIDLRTIVKMEPNANSIMHITNGPIRNFLHKYDFITIDNNSEMRFTSKGLNFIKFIKLRLNKVK